MKAHLDRPGFSDTSTVIFLEASPEKVARWKAVRPWRLISQARRFAKCQTDAKITPKRCAKDAPYGPTAPPPGSFRGAN